MIGGTQSLSLFKVHELQVSPSLSTGFGIIKTSTKALELGKMFQGFLVFGAGILIAIQAAFNIGVNLGILPTKGLTLPFISYGGTSLILFMFLMGIVLRINFENRTIK